MSSSLFLAAVVLLFQPVEPVGPSSSMMLHADRTAIEPGGKIGIAIEIHVEKHWHIYHDVILDGNGLPTEFTFSLPPGFSVGEVRFPKPSLLDFRGSEYLGYENQATFFVEVTAPTTAVQGQRAEVGVAAKGLVCNDEKGCVRFEAASSTQLDIRAGGAPANKEKIDAAIESLSPSLANGPHIEGSEIASATEKVPVGGRGELRLNIKIARKHHMQAPDPGVEGLIGARLFVQSIDGIMFEDPIWPPPKTRDAPSVGKVNEYTGEVKVAIPFAINDANFQARKIDLKIVLYYQVCDDKVCFPPEMVEGKVRFEVVPAGAAESVQITTRPTESGSSAAPKSTERKPAKHLAGGLPWEKWEPGLPEKLAGEGKLVYVDFTAEWCTTCKQNKNLVLEVNPVRAKLLELGAVMLEGDFTNEDPAIKAELRKYRRAGVPLNLVYARNRPDKPIVLSELLTSSYVLDRLEDAKAGRVDVKTVEFLGLGVFGVFLFAFLGGVILNIMPCVLPVLSLKLFSLMQQAQDEPERIFRLGLVYGAGILVSFIPLAVLMVGGGVAWGGLMQKPVYVISMAAITFAFALSMLGVWELRLPGVVENVAGAVTTREGFGGSFLNGFMATALATPCVGPFLGPAIGFLVTQPPWVAGLGILTVGVGLAFPMVLLTSFPAWQHFMPKPGKWMITFKQVMGFTLVATVLWLLRTLRYLGTPNDMLAVLTLLFGVGLACWTLGRITLSDSTPRRTALWSVALLMIAGSWYAGRYIFPPELAGVVD
ncbi:MAG: thioredoxin family protein [Phycisphaerales bacterium]|nr:thioredoxin family protein [Phycisphaerales bacterium]